MTRAQSEMVQYFEKKETEINNAQQDLQAKLQAFNLEFSNWVKTEFGVQDRFTLTQILAKLAAETPTIIQAS